MRNRIRGFLIAPSRKRSGMEIFMNNDSKLVRMLLRVSSNQQLEADGDLSVQRQLVKEYIESHENWRLDNKEYFEGSKSGYKNTVIERDVLQQALQDAMNQEYDILVVYKDDRIGRRMWEIGAYVMQLKSYGVDIYTVKDGCISPETDDIMGQMMLALRYGNAQKSSSDTGMRVKDTAQKLVQKGKFMGGKAPYGYELVFSGEISKHGRALKKLQIVEEKADIVKYIYNLSLTKEYGSYKIAEVLNSNDDCVKLAPNDFWKSGTITSILTNPVYAGYVAYKRREHINGKYLRLNDEEWIKSENRNENIAIIDEDIWNEVQRKRKLRSKEYQKTFSENEYNLIKKNDGNLPFIDVAYCGYCGAKLTNNSQYSYWTIKNTGEKRSSRIGVYRCQMAKQGIPHDKTCLFRADKIEGVILEDIYRYLDSLLENVDLSQNVKYIKDNEYQKLKKTLDKNKRELLKIKNGIDIMEKHIPEAMMGNYILSIEQLAHAIKKHKTNLQETEKKIQNIQERMDSVNSSNKEIDDIKNNIPKWKEIFMGTDKHTQRVIINKIIDKVIMKKDEIHIVYKIKI